MPFDYSVESARYDVTRGGQERVQAAAVAIAELVPHPGTLLDVAGGTIIVSTRIAAHGLIPAGETSFVAVGQRGEPAYTVLSLARAGTRPKPTRSNRNRRRHGCDGIPAGS